MRLITVSYGIQRLTALYGTRYTEAGPEIAGGAQPNGEFSVKYPFAIAALGLLALGFRASTRAEDQSVPAATNVPGAQTPNIHSDRRITFSLKAPDATSLQVAGGDGLGMGPFPMTKGTDGTWSVTTPPSVPGFHYYWFVLNGVAVNDPASETYFGYGKETSGIEVPESGADFYAIQNVPHGEVRAKWYLSKTTGEWRRAFVYTPPGYDEHPSTRYPVLILQHGSGEDETGWTRQGRAQFILDNLIAAGKARPMIVVMDRGYAQRAGTANSTPEVFDTKTAYGGAFADPSAFNRRVKLLWLGVGSAESDQFRGGIGGAVEALRMAGVRLEYFESKGTAHEWQTWRRSLNDFAPRLFR
jgi:hypothetical protein